MADLPSIANRINDIEVAANAPITETLKRREGSSNNFLLDFLGIADGSTTAAGDLSDLIAAVGLCSGHTMDLQVSVPSSGSGVVATTVGTYTPVKFVNQVFYYVIRNNSGFDLFGKTVNIGLNTTFVLNGATLPVLADAFAATVNANHTHTLDSAYTSRPNNTTRRYSKHLSPGEYTADVTNGNFFLTPACVLDWRDGGTQTLTANLEVGVGNFSAIEVYRQYVLDIKSAGF